MIAQEMHQKRAVFDFRAQVFAVHGHGDCRHDSMPYSTMEKTIKRMMTIAIRPTTQICGPSPSSRAGKGRASTAAGVIGCCMTVANLAKNSSAKDLAAP